MEFQEGDVVRLKSGGPDMTVIEVDEEYGCSCQWFDTKGNLMNSNFNPKALEKPSDDVDIVFDVIRG
ncbi:YodC family protein [Thaumasiovibrio subtropicus]|uniref:YodC family protein n=1 Tax=Thaumasiovibrio subtropicus TaxID=1891207 RepID=UPI000B34AABC|nr:DUF2158 domain-containing protein [Thaumasiovibrio subtropicus]